jgi:hypothetical protein
MPVPSYDKFIEPILRHLAAHPEGVPARDVHEAAAVVLAGPGVIVAGAETPDVRYPF